MDDIVGTGRVVDLWHLDVEGAEVPVLLSARRLFEQRRIRRVVLEFIPFRWPGHGYSLYTGLAAIQPLFREGWTCHIVCPQEEQHHRVNFDWSTIANAQKVVSKHISPKGKTVCENLYCVVEGIEPLPELRKRIGELPIW